MYKTEKQAHLSLTYGFFMSCMALQASEDHQTFVETEPENLNFHFAPTFLIIINRSNSCEETKDEVS